MFRRAREGRFFDSPGRDGRRAGYIYHWLLGRSAMSSSSALPRNRPPAGQPSELTTLTPLGLVAISGRRALGIDRQDRAAQVSSLGVAEAKSPPRRRRRRPAFIFDSGRRLEVQMSQSVAGISGCGSAEKGGKTNGRRRL
ncbi:hypothetical protein L596_016007 [Steinernema carpocapsae]|uniref:Uncharacterized protein n=1 Tax=Steinernema carpocapsae TaxID=34508 RepID=A0A4U5NGQ6_STECR|nr:hypothetical protein L596_016007 [Steinernema carpocapsae]